MAMAPTPLSTIVCICFCVLPCLADKSDPNFVHTFNQNFLDTIIRTKDSRTFLNDLINKIQSLLNDSSHPAHYSTAMLLQKHDDVSTGQPLKEQSVQTTLSESASKTTAVTSDFSVPFENMTIFNETAADMAVEGELKKLVKQDTRQRVATLGVLICLTFVGTATCIVVIALYSSKFSGIVLLSNGRWWCPMVTRGSGVERQLLV
ncbi:uncharacterized protein LOC135400082 [Ornithodoros turicata]|uniref:uncharacterized protein LOC135400082 n=1 Tax=Ornithodoros turicata TaxID=34597 RepID=UPI0031398E76